MAQLDTPKLDAGDEFPAMEFDLVGGGSFRVPTPRWDVVLFYRGHWCSDCRHQLADFQDRIEEFQERDAVVVAASVDGQSDAKRLVAELGLRFPVGYRLKADDIALRYGAFYHGKRRFLHATGFVVDPDNRVRAAVYSSGSVGRLTAARVLRLLDYYQEQEHES